MHQFQGSLISNAISQDYWHFKGFAEIELEDHVEALKSYTQAVKLDNNNDFFWQCKGNLEYSLRDFNEALKSYTRSVELDPTNHYSWMNKAKVECLFRNFNDALESYDQASQIITGDLEADTVIPDWKLELEHELLEINDARENVVNCINSSLENDKNSATTQYMPEYIDNVWFTKQIKNEESSRLKINEKSLKEDLQNEFNEEWAENFEDEYDEDDG